MNFDRAIVQAVLRSPAALATSITRLLPPRPGDPARRLDPRVNLTLWLGETTKKPGLTSGGAAKARLRYAETIEALESTLARPCATRDGALLLEGRKLRVRAYHPAQFTSALPVIVYFHGGGFVLGDLSTHANICHRLAQASQCVVVAVDYRLAPEHPFPAATDDAEQSLSAFAALEARFCLDLSRVGVAGDSAGGNLAFLAALANSTRDAKSDRRVRVKAQLLYYPVISSILGEQDNNQSRERFALGFGLEAVDMANFVEDYAPDAGLDPRIHLHLHDDLALSPMARIVVAGFDPLRDEGRSFAALLRTRGAEVTVREHDAWIHGYLHMGALAGVKESIHEDGLWLGDALRS